MRTAAALSMPTYIALPVKPRPTKWRDEVAGDGAEPLGPGEQRVLAAEPARELALGVLVELGLLQQRGRARRRSPR